MPDPGVLDELPILRFLPDETRAQIVRRFVPETFPFGGVLAAEGEAVDALYVLVSGRARVVKRTDNDDEVPLNVLQAGDSFGEAELFQGRPHPTTVRAASDVLALRLDRVRVPGSGRHRPLRRHVSRAAAQTQHAAGVLPRLPRVRPAPHRGHGRHRARRARAESGGRGRDGRRRRRPGGAAAPDRRRPRARDAAASTARRSISGRSAAGQYFGEESALTGSPRHVTVEAITPCRFLAARRRHGAAAGRRRARVPPAARGAHRAVRLQDAGAHARRHRQGAAAGRRRRPGTGRRVDQVDQVDGAECRRRGAVRGRGTLRQAARAACGACGSCAKSTRWTAAPRAWPWSRGHFGRAVSLARIRQLVNTGLDGTSLRSLCSAAEELGLAARSVKASLHNLDRMPLPAICHWDGDHWLLLYHVTRRHVLRRRPGARLPPACRARSSSGGGPATRRSSTTRTAFEHAPAAPGRSRLAVAARPSAHRAHRQGARPRRRRQRLRDGAAGLHAGHRGPRAGRAGPVAAAAADRRHGRHDGLHRRRRYWRSAISSASWRFASTPPGSTSSRGGCSRCR